MKLRYIKYPDDIREGGCFYFNLHALSEVDMGDDSAFISDLEVWLESDPRWQPLSEAFSASPRKLITDNYNTHFFEPRNDEERDRGYSL